MGPPAENLTGTGRQRPRKRVRGAPDRSEILFALLSTTESLRGVLMVALFKLRIRR